MNAYILSLPRSHQKSFFHKFMLALTQVRLRLNLYRLRCLPILKRLDAVADTIRASWLLFLELANKVQNSGVWRLYANTWQAFCRKRWNIDSSRISQLRSAKPYALILKSLGSEPLEGEIRKFKSLLAANNPMLSKVYSLGQAVAKSEGRATTPAIYKRSLEVLETAQETGGVYPVGDELYFIQNEKDAVSAVLATLEEAKKVGREGASVPVEVQALRCGDYWELRANGQLPDNFKFTVYMKG